MKACSNCGAEVPDDARICPQCSFPQAPGSAPGVSPPPDAAASETSSLGATTTALAPASQTQEAVSPPQEMAPAPQAGVKQTEGLAIASMVCGILGLFMVPVVLSIVAIVLGNQSKKKIRQSGGTLEGEGLAKAGIILGIVGLVLIAIVIVILIAVISVAVVSNASGASALYV